MLGQGPANEHTTTTLAEPMHEIIQSYLEHLYRPFSKEIKQSLLFYDNEHYGELYYYSAVKLLKYLNISNTDHVLDVGSGLGRIVFQFFLTTHAASVTGIEINGARHDVSRKIKQTMENTIPDFFVKSRELKLIHGDFLKHDFEHISLIYLCSLVFSFKLLDAVGEKINAMSTVSKVVSFGKIPNLTNFKITKKLYLHCSWDKVGCYIYERRTEHGF